MKKSLLLIILLASACAAVAVAQSPEKLQKPTDVLSTQVTATEAADLSTPAAFAKALLASSVPGGIARVSNCNPDPLMQRWKPMTSTLKDVLDSIVAADRLYGWHVHNGAVNLIPRRRTPPLLNVVIGDLEIKDATSLHLPLSKLVALPEVRQTATALNLQEALNILVIPTSLKPSSRTYTFHFRNVTLQEALNEIVRAHGRAVWEYRERSCDGKKEYAIDFIIQ
jgi:hypothetical protein